MEENKRIQGIDEKMPIEQIVKEFFFDREKTSSILFHLWKIFSMALESEDVENSDHIERGNMAYDFERFFILVLRLNRHRETSE
jgi:hypothetical protein